MTLPSKKRSSGIVDVVDVGYLVDAFEVLNSCTLSVCFERTTKAGVPDLMVIASAYTLSPVGAERVPLVSFRSSLSALNCVSLEGAFILALYRLDGLLAAHELQYPAYK
jgi:hypothetical protein